MHPLSRLIQCVLLSTENDKYGTRGGQVEWPEMSYITGHSMASACRGGAACDRCRGLGSH